MRKTPFEINKYVQGVTKCVYRDGKEAHVIRVDPENPQPVLTTNRRKKLFRHYTDGVHIEDRRESNYDLFIVVERILRSWTYDEVPEGALIRLRCVAEITYTVVGKSEYDVILESEKEGFFGREQKSYS